MPTVHEPLKKLKMRYLNGQCSSLNTFKTSMPIAPLGRGREDSDELSKMHCTKLTGTRGMEESPQETAERTMKIPLLIPSQLLGQSKGKQPSSSDVLVVENVDPSHPSSMSKRDKKEVKSCIRNIRIRNALRAMKVIGIKEGKVRPVLKALLISTGSNWELIEEENYRALADAVLKRDQREVEEHPRENVDNETQGLSNEEAHEAEEPEGPLGRLKRVYLDGQSSSLNMSNTSMLTTPPGRPKEVPDELSKTHCTKLNGTRGMEELPQKNVELTMTMPLLVTSKSLGQSKGKQPSSSNSSVHENDDPCHPSSISRSQHNVRNAPIIPSHPMSLGHRGIEADSRSGTKVRQRKNGMNGGTQLNKLDAEDEIVINKENQGRIQDVVDIARGLEKIAITLVNEVNDERPPSFCYIRQNIIFQNAYANFSLSRVGDNNCCSTCSGDCLSLPVPCACSHETGGGFAYTADGLVKEEFLNDCISMNRNPEKHCQYYCKECPLERLKCEDVIEPCRGHLVRKFVKECWIKCGCTLQCGNRVVQRGISRKLQVFMTPKGKGWGLRTLEDLPKGAFVCEYIGEILTNTELSERVSRIPEGEKHSYPVLLDADWCVEGVLDDEEALCLDATYYGNIVRFINHRCYDSNLVEIPVEVETPDHHYYHLAFFTSRKVKAMEELTWDYGIDFDDPEHPIKAFHCQCGSKFCRNKSKACRR